MKQKLLLVDDRPENLLVLESTLEDDGLEFVRAESDTIHTLSLFPLKVQQTLLLIY